ncbi:MAG: hypothetical protein JXA92_00745, partial [candidate division Zixibacteria bacterium]|nr:hypothetical protein [candidate division Zixibacteria bacterium]
FFKIGGFMNTAGFRKNATLMIYTGTLLISILSFFTTYFGLAILVNKTLALIGSLGLQIAMLGIAWNLIRIKENRFAYASVFLIAAVFSVFFSYVNFNTNLKANTRPQQIRAEYTAAARPVLDEYGARAKEAAFKGNYQLARIDKLLEMEEARGWATIIDEGSEDAFIQSVIDGARRTVASWKENQGTDYHQGSGRGIIVDYITGWRRQTAENLEEIKKYIVRVDSIAVNLSREMPVSEQYEQVNWAVVHFPSNPVMMLAAEELTEMPSPPYPSDFVEYPSNRQEAFMLVINDLLTMDRLTLFSLVFAFVIDFIVIVMALAGSYVFDDVDYIFSRVERNAAKMARRISIDETGVSEGDLDSNIERLRQAGRYGLDISKVLCEFEDAKKKIKLMRGEEKVSDKNESKKIVI